MQHAAVIRDHHPRFGVHCAPREFAGEPDLAFHRTTTVMSVYAPSLPASPSIRPTDVDVRRLFQTPTTSVAGPSSLPAPSASANPSPCPSPGPPSAHPLSSSPHAHTSGHHGRRSQVSRNRFNAELSQCLLDFVVQLLPTTEELRIKEDVRKLLERLIRTIDPNSRLLTFGSSANGFALRNSGAFHPRCPAFRSSYEISHASQIWTYAVSSSLTRTSVPQISSACWGICSSEVGHRR
jgi:hypothetical protein